MKSEQESFHLPPGTVLRDKYIVRNVTGYGVFVVTYVAWDTMQEQRVVIKEWLPYGHAFRMPGGCVTVYKEDMFYDGKKDFSTRRGLQNSRTSRESSRYMTALRKTIPRTLSWNILRE